MKSAIIISSGGNQIQDFKSTGTYTTAGLSGLILHHATSVYVTVVATNAVGLSTVVHADPVIVDLTPPVIEILQVGLIQINENFLLWSYYLKLKSHFFHLALPP